MTMSTLEKIVAIDGPAGSGKSTTAKEVARRLGWQYIDTGAMYRALALAVIRSGADTTDTDAVRPVLDRANVSLGEGELPPVLLDGENVSKEIRTEEVSQGASKVSVHGFVRSKLVELQRAMGLRAPSVLEGRDITSVVFPNAGLKIFLDASVEERAKRRQIDYKRQGKKVSLEEMVDDIKIRDHRDSTRAEGPLMKVADAEIIDTTGMTIDDQINTVVQLAEKRFQLTGRNG